MESYIFGNNTISTKWNGGEASPTTKGWRLITKKKKILKENLTQAVELEEKGEKCQAGERWRESGASNQPFDGTG